MGIIENFWLKKGLDKLNQKDPVQESRKPTVFEVVDDARTHLKSSVSAERYMELEALTNKNCEDLKDYLNKMGSTLQDSERAYIQAVINAS